MQASIIIGAGFSYVAGLPLTRDIFEDNGHQFTRSKRVQHLFQRVIEEWQAWKKNNEGANTEQWLAHLYSNFQLGGVSWEQAVQLLLARLVKIETAQDKPIGKREHTKMYRHGITKPGACEVHKQFWHFLRQQFEIKSIVTTNYDILIEQEFREGPAKRRLAPLCYYGGLHRPQYVKRVIDLVLQL
jgi:hypothetical protein